MCFSSGLNMFMSFDWNCGRFAARRELICCERQASVAQRGGAAKENQKAKGKWQRVKVKGRTFKNRCSKKQEITVWQCRGARKPA
jgi:hypothetical protein